MNTKSKLRIVYAGLLVLALIFGLRYVYSLLQTAGEKLLVMDSSAGRALLDMQRTSFIWFIILLAVYFAVKFMTYDPKKN